jgi:hypothetical protein
METITLTLSREQSFILLKLVEPNSSLYPTFLLIAQAMRSKGWI